MGDKRNEGKTLWRRNSKRDLCVGEMVILQWVLLEIGLYHILFTARPQWVFSSQAKVVLLSTCSQELQSRTFFYLYRQWAIVTSRRTDWGTNLDDWLTVLHRSITLVNFQIDAQNSYLFIYNTFIKILYMFRALPC